MDFKEQYDLYLKAVEKKIEEFFSFKNMPQKNVIDAMRYAVTAGGKRLRPVLVMASAKLCGADLEDAASVALAVECIHNYSLIHDDLPCMDNDELRRGRPTCHKVFGESTALLAGDGLLNTAFEILSDKKRYKSIDDAAMIKIIACLSSASGVLGMIGGQIVDLECEGRGDVSFDELAYLHTNKTGALIRASVKCGCLCGNSAEASRYIRLMDSFAERLGMAFQVKDDILDFEGDEAILGKPIGSDAESRKSTFVTVLGMASAKEYLEKCTNEAKSIIEPLGEKAAFFSCLAEYLLKRDY